MLLLLLVLAAGFRFPTAVALQFGVVTPQDLNEAVLRAVGNQTVHSQCETDFGRWMDGLSRGELWAIQIADSWTKAPTGVFYGNKFDLGNFDECVRASSDSGRDTPSSLAVIRGGYLLPTLRISSTNQGAAPLSPAGRALSRAVPLSLSAALCVPASCDARLVVAALDAVARDLLRGEGLGDHFTASVSLALTKLQTEDNANKPAWPEWALLVVAVFLIALAVVATVLDNMLEKPDSRNVVAARLRWRCLLHFSLSSGMRRLMAPAPATTMRCINGLRVMSTLWIMLGHTETFYPTVMNDFEVKKMQNSWSYVLMNAYDLAVDTFLAVSGLVLCMSFLKSDNKNGFNWFKYAFRRYARTTPVTALTILFGATWFRMLATGADTVNSDDALPNFFRKYWWTSLVPIANFFGDQHHVLTHIWYMSCDLQLYLVAPVVLVPLWKRPRAGLALLGLVTLAACLTPAIISVLHHYAPESDAGLSLVDASYRFRITILHRTYCRAAPYFVGIAAGYVLFQVKHRGLKLQLNGPQAAALWVLTAAVGFAVVLAPRSILLDEGHPYSAVEDFFYRGFVKPTWGIVIAFIIIMCETGWGGPINKILSWSAFAPLGKLSFAVYLVHFFFVLVDYIYYVHVPEYFSIYNLTRHLLASSVIAVPLAGLLHLVVEQPFILLESELWKK